VDKKRGKISRHSPSRERERDAEAPSARVPLSLCPIEIVVKLNYDLYALSTLSQPVRAHARKHEPTRVKKGSRVKRELCIESLPKRRFESFYLSHKAPRRGVSLSLSPLCRKE
jgi:hypothetical protein